VLLLEHGADSSPVMSGRHPAHLAPVLSLFSMKKLA
jgi:hypothetical protein